MLTEDSTKFTLLLLLVLLLLKLRQCQQPLQQLSILLLVEVEAVEPTWEVEAVEAVSFKVRLPYQPPHTQLLLVTEELAVISLMALETHFQEALAGKAQVYLV
jgi:hypothetical protein